LNDVFLKKDLNGIWRLWRSKVGFNRLPYVIDGLCDEKVIADIFSDFLNSLYA